MLVKVDITSFGIDPNQNIPLVILKESGGARSLPILIGSAEASAIALKAMDISAHRPLTVDLVKLVMNDLGGSLVRAVIYDLVDQVFFAHIHIVTKTAVHIIDCRPSDAIALAMRCESPIFVEGAVFEKNEHKNTLSERDTLKRDIANSDTLEFGTYYME